jgi:pimeloyl-ACP methyl ester carboxylesterase
MIPRARWDRPDFVWFDVEWELHIDDDGHLTKAMTFTSRVALNDTRESFEVTVRDVKSLATGFAGTRQLGGDAATTSEDFVQPRQHTVLLVHGIRTTAEWQDSVRATLEASDQTIRVIPTSYEFFDLFRFLFPFSTFRRRPLERVTALVRAEITNPRTKRLSLIGHSFGTWLIAKMLEDEPDLVFHRVILCGSVIPQKFRWDLYAHRIGRDGRTEWPILNDCGSRDIWPALAQSVTWGYGASGRFGFGHVNVRDRFHDLAHSGFFTEEFVRDFWAPYLTLGEVTPSLRQRKRSPWFLSVITFPIKLRWILLAASLALAWAAVQPRFPERAAFSEPFETVLGWVGWAATVASTEQTVPIPATSPVPTEPPANAVPPSRAESPAGETSNSGAAVLGVGQSLWAGGGGSNLVETGPDGLPCGRTLDEEVVLQLEPPDFFSWLRVVRTSRRSPISSTDPDQRLCNVPDDAPFDLVEEFDANLLLQIKDRATAEFRTDTSIDFKFGHNTSRRERSGRFQITPDEKQVHIEFYSGFDDTFRTKYTLHRRPYR